MTIDLPAARTFVLANGRVLEQHACAARFDGADPAAVVAALCAYRNPDGGFGHGLEPDKRCPASQPLDVEVALARLLLAGAKAPDLVAGACDFLAGVAGPGGAVPVLMPSIAGHPRAAHWAAADEYPPALNPTASIAGLVAALGGQHPWADAATTWCLAAVEAGDGLPTDAHALRCVALLLEHAVDAETAERLGPVVAAALHAADHFQPTPDAGTYGLTPLEIAPSPGCRARAWFDDAAVSAHLDDLERRQQADGGWPIAWDPPSEASRCEWRAIRTLDALDVLDAYGRLD
jgi:hypothetical protein